MEFDFVVTSICRDLITVWDGTTIYHLSPDVRKQITAIINRMGAASSRAQGLGAIITTTSRLCMNVHTGQRLYLYRDPKNEKKVCGLLKIGRKKLFLRDNVGRMRELNASCVLDFYVHESCQRRGIGKALFQHMLKAEQLPAAKFAIDRPSHKFLAFLRKHYKLGKFTPQNNNFVVFDQYFKAKVKHRKESSKLNFQAFPAGKSTGQVRAPPLPFGSPPATRNARDSKLPNSTGATRRMKSRRANAFDREGSGDSVSKLLSSSMEISRKLTPSNSFRASHKQNPTSRSNSASRSNATSRSYNVWKEAKSISSSPLPPPHNIHNNGNVRGSYDRFMSSNKIMSLSPPYAVSPSQTATSVSLRTSSTTPLPSYRKSQQIRGESINTSPFGKLSYGSPLQNDLAKSSEGTKILSNNGYNRNSIILGPATEYRSLDPRVALDAARNADSTKRVNRY
eukprot:jgi/Bigna1/89397/estExt_fgenesh1_pg.C_480120